MQHCIRVEVAIAQQWLETMFWSSGVCVAEVAKRYTGAYCEFSGVSARGPMNELLISKADGKWCRSRCVVNFPAAMMAQIRLYLRL